DHRVANGKPLRREDVGLLTVGIADQRDESRPVGVVFDPDNLGLDVKLVTLEIHDAVEPLYAATTPAHGDPSGVVPSALARQTLGEGLDGAAFPQLGTVDQNQPALARRRRLVCL